MPMSAQVCGVFGNDNEVTSSRGDDRLATGTQIFLACLVWLDCAHDHGVQCGVHARLPEEGPQDDARSEQSKTHHENDISGRLVLRSERIEAHRSAMVRHLSAQAVPRGHLTTTGR